jgi:peptide/nickel transport system substrate-binding protein
MTTKRSSLGSNPTSRRELLQRSAVLGAGSLAASMSLGGLSFAQSGRSGEVVVISGADISTLDPFKTNALKDLTVISAMNQRLTRMSAKNYGQVEPLLATGWEAVKPDRWRMKLRENVRFHNGAEFNAETAKWSLEHYAKDAIFKAVISALDRVEIVDRHTIDVVTQYPTALIPLMLNAGCEQVDPAWMTGSDYRPDKSIGTGPARLVEWIKGQHVVLERNKEYWGKPIDFERFVTRAVTEAATRANAALAGEGDIVRNVLGQDVPRFANRPGVAIKKVGSNRCAHVRIREDIPPFGDKRIRQALNYAVDVDAIVTYVLKGFGTPVQGQLQGQQARYWQQSVKSYPFDPEKAKALLAQAGFPKGLSVKMGTSRGRDQGDFEFSSAVAGQLRDVGVEVDLIVHEPGLYQAKYSGQEPAEPLFYWSSGNIIPDAENAYRDLTAKRGGLEVRSPEFLDLYAQVQRAIDPNERQKLTLEATRFLNDYCPVIFGYQLQQVYAVSNRVRWEPRSDEYIYLDEIDLV